MIVRAIGRVSVFTFFQSECKVFMEFSNSEILSLDELVRKTDELKERLESFGRNGGPKEELTQIMIEVRELKHQSFAAYTFRKKIFLGF